MAVSFEKKLDLIRKANATLKKEKITTLLGQASKIDSYSSENQTKIKGNVDSLYNQIAQAYAQKKKAVAQANAPTTKTRKKPKKEDTMMGYASMIMKRDNITWKQALKKSKDHFADLRTKKQDAEKKALEDFEKKVGAVEFEKATRYKIRGGTKGTDIERDKVRPALPSGKRIVRTKGKTTNQYGTYNNKIGKVYYEKRANRMDVNQPSKSVYPKLADGGEMKDGKFSYKDYFQAQGGIKFQSEEEAKQFIKSAKPFVRKKLRGGDLVLVNNGKEYFIAEKVMIDDKYAKGGKIGFDALAKKVARSYKGKKVKAKYQNEYGKTYDSKEAMEVGQKVASKVYRRQLARKSKMADGGTIGESYSVQIFANGQVGEYPIFPNAKRKFDDLNDAMKFAKSMVEENYSEIDKIKIFSSDGRLVQEFNNRDSDKNVKEAYLYKQKIPNNYQGKSAEKVWSLLTPYQRSHYLDDHENGQYKELVHSDWNDLNDRVRNGFEMHVQQGQYANGGEVDKKKYKFEITEYKDENAVINDEPTISDYEGTKEKVIDFQYQRMQRGYCVYFNITIVADSNNKGWFYESEDLDDLIDEIENSDDDNNDFEYTDYEKIMKAYGYAKGGEVAESNRNMALNKAKELCHHVDELHNVLKGKKHIEAWVIAKLERASSDLSDVTHYLDGLSEQKTH